MKIVYVEGTKEQMLKFRGNFKNPSPIVEGEDGLFRVQITTDTEISSTNGAVVTTKEKFDKVKVKK